ncbi:MAG: hypothetical protein ACRDQ2_14885 [Gaiellales bacterium]
MQQPHAWADTDSMRRARAISLLSLTALLLVAVPAADARKPRPYVKSVTPLSASVGEEMTIQGFYFTPGYAENTVVFVAKDGRVSYVKSEHSTKTTMQVIVPKKIERLLPIDDNGLRIPTKFRIKVIARRMSRLAKRPLAMPLIGPDVGGDCDGDGIPNPTDTDDDGDFLPDTIEETARTNPCVADSDGDKLLDGWEYLSALDLNHNAVPYPGKKPFPNALYADADVDYDGDGMPSWSEHAMWWFGGHKYPLDYSDGDQATIDLAAPIPGENNWWLDINFDGDLSDDERDWDNDSLSNVAEYRFLDYEPWEGYPGVIRPDFMDPDTDGDGLPDGPDDQDHDDFSNIDETLAGTWQMNPCDPNPHSRTCPKYQVKGEFPVRPDGLCPSSTQLNGGQVPWTPKFDLVGFDPEADC